MRIALISTIAAPHAGDALLRPLAGRSVAQRQVDLALALKCERIACLADAPSPQVVAMQHSAERAGAQFNALTNTRGLAGLVHAADEVLVLAPGVLPQAGLLSAALGDRPSVLVLPAEEAVPAGFERIDRDFAWAGVLLARGAAVERLNELPSDSDPISSMLRIALQSGTRVVALPGNTLADGKLMQAGSAEALTRAESAWLGASEALPGWRTPGLAIAARLARRTAARALRTGRAVSSAEGAGALATAAGAVLGWEQKPAFALALLCVAAGAFVLGRTWRKIERGPAPRTRSGRWRTIAAEICLDAAFAVTTVLAVPLQPASAAFAAAVLILAIRIAGREPADGWARPASDRILLFALLALAACFGSLLPAIQVVAIAALAAMLASRSSATANAGLTTQR
ncbi:MAG: hypothetical protein ACTHK5_06080 [Tsuneonella sp.]